MQINVWCLIQNQIEFCHLKPFKFENITDFCSFEFGLQEQFYGTDAAAINPRFYRLEAVTLPGTAPTASLVSR